MSKERAKELIKSDGFNFGSELEWLEDDIISLMESYHQEQMDNMVEDIKGAEIVNVQTTSNDKRPIGSFAMAGYNNAIEDILEIIKKHQQ